MSSQSLPIIQTEQQVVATGRQSFTTTVFVRAMTITRTDVGRYTIALNDPHPDGDDYPISLAGAEGANRDNPKVIEVVGTRDQDGFDVMVTIDDNGGNADVYVDDEFSVTVFRV